MLCIFQVMRVKCGTVSNTGVATHCDENSGFLECRQAKDVLAYAPCSSFVRSLASALSEAAVVRKSGRALTFYGLRRLS